MKDQMDGRTNKAGTLKTLPRGDLKPSACQILGYTPCLTGELSTRLLGGPNLTNAPLCLESLVLLDPSQSLSQM